MTEIDVASQSLLGRIKNDTYINHGLCLGRRMFLALLLAQVLDQIAPDPTFNPPGNPIMHIAVRTDEHGKAVECRLKAPESAPLQSMDLVRLYCKDAVYQRVQFKWRSSTNIISLQLLAVPTFSKTN